MNPAPLDSACSPTPQRDSLAACAGYASSCGRVTLYLGDSVELRHLVPADAAIISDPPYGMSLNTDSSRFTGPRGGHVNTAGYYGDKIIEDEKPFDPAPWLAWEKVVLFGSNHFGARLPVGTKLIWIKRLDAAFGSFLSDAEEAWMKGGHGIYCKRDLSMAGETLTRQHPCQKPVPLMAWCMDKAKVPAGAVVVDPYMGSGTTGIACIRTGRRFVGVEKDPAHYATALARITNELAQGDLFLGHNS